MAADFGGDGFEAAAQLVDLDGETGQGGGVLAAGACDELRQVAERLGAPVFHTLMGKSAFPADHPLAAGLPWKRGTSDARDMGTFMSPLFADAD